MQDRASWANVDGRFLIRNGADGRIGRIGAFGQVEDRGPCGLVPRQSRRSFASCGSSAASSAALIRDFQPSSQARAAGVLIAWPILPLAHSRQRPVPREIQKDRAFGVNNRPQPAQGRAVLGELLHEPPDPFPLKPEVDKDLTSR